MTTSRTLTRFITYLFLLAGLLLLRKPVFGQTISDDSRHPIMYDQPAAFDKPIQAFLKP